MTDARARKAARYLGLDLTGAVGLQVEVSPDKRSAVLTVVRRPEVVAADSSGKFKVYR